MMFTLTRYPTRYLYHKIRMAYLGPTVWSEVIFEGAMNEKEIKKAVAQMDNMGQIMPTSVGNMFHLYYDRPIYTMIIRRSSTDEQVHMYIGVDERHYSQSQIESWAAGANCSVERVDEEELDLIITGTPSIAVLTGYDTGAITRQPNNDQVGNVVSKIQGSITDGEAGTIIISYEPMRESEESLLKNHAGSKVVIEGGGHYAALDGSQIALRDFSSLSPSRGVIATFADDGSQRNSNNLMNIALSSMPALGMRTTIVTPSQITRRDALVGLLGIIPLFILSLIGSLSIWIPFVVSICVIAGSMGLASFLSTPFYRMIASNGVLAIPPFFRFSWRRLLSQYMSNTFSVRRKEFDSHNVQGYQVKEPSTREIIPFYRTSLMQFMSMPLGGSGTRNISTSIVPQIPMEDIVLSDIKEDIKNDDVIYNGISVKRGSPVYRTIKDLNFGIAVSGVAGSGKTNTLMVDFLGASRLSRQKTGIAGKMKINPIWLETKPDNIEELLELSRPYKPLFLQLHDRNSKFRLSLEGPRYGDNGVTIDNILQNRNLFINALQAVWGQAMGPRSTQVANAAFTIALLLTPEEIKKLRIEDRISHIERPNVVVLAKYLIGGDPGVDVRDGLQALAEDLQTNVFGKNEAVKQSMGQLEIDRQTNLLGSIGQLLKLYEDKEAFRPLLNKLPVLEQSEGLFEPYTRDGKLRKEYGVEKFYKQHRPVILDLTATGSNLTKDGTELFTMMVHYMLWQSIQMNCRGWASKGLLTPIYADEVTNITGRKGTDAGNACTTILGEVRDQGRSYGVSHNVGYQHLSQLPDDAANSIMTFDSFIFYRNGNPHDQEIIMRQIGERSKFTKENLSYFPQGIGIAFMRIGGKVRSPFTMKSPKADLWGHALTVNNDQTVHDAFQNIRDQEQSILKEEKKKKIDDARQERSEEYSIEHNNEYFYDGYNDGDFSSGNSENNFFDDSDDSNYEQENNSNNEQTLSWD